MEKAIEELFKTILNDEECSKVLNVLASEISEQDMVRILLGLKGE